MSADDEDFTSWHFWWEFNRDRFLRIKQAVRTGAPQTGSDDFYLDATHRTEGDDSLMPTTDMIRRDVVPDLWRALTEASDRDMTSAAMVALAKIGKRKDDGTPLLAAFLPRLQSRDQEVRETAALCIGIAGELGQSEIGLLTDLALDRPKGRTAVAHTEVDDRTRSFAIYGLGLLARRSSDAALHQAVFQALSPLLAADAPSTRSQHVAAVHALGMLPITGSAAPDSELRGKVLAVLTDYYTRDAGVAEQNQQAHCPAAMARLLALAVATPEAEPVRRLLLRDLSAASGRRNPALSQSCALALGSLCTPWRVGSPDARTAEALLTAARDHTDAQTRNFAWIGLGQMGGPEARARLCAALPKVRRLERPWVAIAIGVLAFEARNRSETSDLDSTVAEALTDALAIARTPDDLGAVAIAIGLSGAASAAPLLQKHLGEHPGQDELTGHLCIGLALLGDRSARAGIAQILAHAQRRPELLRQAATALGKLGDKEAAGRLQAMLGEGEPNLTRLSAVASALGVIGDRRSVAPLRAMLHDSHLTPLTRAFAAVGLGGVCDKDALPWNSFLAVNLNYRAAVDTLTDRTVGILGIL